MRELPCSHWSNFTVTAEAVVNGSVATTLGLLFWHNWIQRGGSVIVIFLVMNATVEKRRIFVDDIDGGLI